MMKPVTLALTLVLGGNFAAHGMNVEYKSFYSHVRKLNDEDTQALQFAFGFLHNRTKTLCEVKSALIHTQKKDIPLEITAEHRFTVPSEKALKLAKAVVAIEVVQPENQCDMSVQLETKPEYLKRAYSAAELTYLFTQYENFFSEMGGFLSFMMPRAQGLVLAFDQKSLPPTLTAEGVALPPLQDNRLVLSQEWLEAFNGQLNLSHAPERITAYLPK